MSSEIDKNLPQNDDSDPWSSALGDILGNEEVPPYEPIAQDDIEDAKVIYPLQATLMQMANENLSEARDRAEGEKEREPEYHDMGWMITFETEDHQYVGLWSCWLGDQLYLGYPHGQKVDDSVIREVLQVDDARPVKDVGATAVNDWDYEGEFGDEDKPLEQNAAGQIIAYQDSGSRQWSKFYGPIENLGGRVWIDHSDFNSNGHQFRVIHGDKLEEVRMGHDHSMNIASYPFSRHNSYAYEGPTTDAEAIQSYRDRFILLAATLAGNLGRVSAVHIDYGFVLVPEELGKENYQNIEWLQGKEGTREGWGRELVMAQRDNQEIALISANKIVPWSTIVKTNIQKEMTPEELQVLVLDELLYL